MTQTGDLTKITALWHEAAGKCRLHEIRIRALEIALRRIADHIGELDNADCARIAYEALNPLAPGYSPAQKGAKHEAKD